MDKQFPLDFTWPDYLFGLLVFIAISAIGIWIIIVSLQGHRTFLKGLLKVPGWLLFGAGMILQVPTVWYIYVGMKAGLFGFK